MSIIFNSVGSEIYQETLAKALAKEIGARLLIVESLLLPGVSSFIIFDCMGIFYVPRILCKSICMHSIESAIAYCYDFSHHQKSLILQKRILRRKEHLR